MLIDAKPAQNPDTFVSAKARLSVGPVPTWVVTRQPNYRFTPKPETPPNPTTVLLWSVQTNCESNANHVQMAARLETMYVAAGVISVALRVHDYSAETREALAHIIAPLLGQAVSEPLIVTLREALDAKRTLLREQSVWQDLGLPQSLHNLLSQMQVGASQGSRA